MSVSCHKTSRNSRVRSKNVISLILILSAIWFVPFSGISHAELVSSFPSETDSASILQRDPLIRVAGADTDLDIPSLEEPVKPIADPRTFQPARRVRFFGRWIPRSLELFGNLPPANFGVKPYDRINKISLTIGEYEDLKEAALDPYIVLRDAHHQLRQEKIRER